MTKDIVGGLLMLAVSILYFLQSMNIRKSSMADDVGAHGVPQAYAVMLGLLAVALVAKGVIERLTSPAQVAATQEERDALKRSLLGMATMLGIGVGYLLVVSTLGYIVSMVLLVAIVAYYLGASPGLQMAAVAVGGTLVLWAVFDLLLGISMPAGIWADWM